MHRASSSVRPGKFVRATTQPKPTPSSKAKAVASAATRRVSNRGSAAAAVSSSVTTAM